VLRKKHIFILFIFSLLVIVLGANVTAFAQDDGGDPIGDVAALSSQLAGTRSNVPVTQGMTANRGSLVETGVVLADGRILVIVELQAEPAARHTQQCSGHARHDRQSWFARRNRRRLS